MLTFALLLAPLVSADCDPANNDPTELLNYLDCNNAGTCVETGGGHHRCDCCTNDPDHWCSDVLGQTFTGPTCTTLEYTYAVGFGWRFETAAGETPAITCSDMDVDPPAAGGMGFMTTPMIQKQVNVALKMKGYNGVSYGAACKTCRPDSPCNYAGLGDVTEGVTAGFATELNTFYSKRCIRFKIDQPFDCAANDDLGLQAYYALSEAFGEQGSKITPHLNSLLQGTHRMCRKKKKLCMKWPNTAATVFAKTSYTATKEVLIPTPMPVEEPAPEPTEEPLGEFKYMCKDSPANWADKDGEGCDVYKEKHWCGASFQDFFADANGVTADKACCACGGGDDGTDDSVPAPQCSNKKYAQCGGTHYKGPECCPAGQHCFQIIQLFSQCNDACLPGWKCYNDM